MADSTFTPSSKKFVIQGITKDGHSFRPSDWADRLCGVMSSFTPQGYVERYAHLGYSPYVQPTMVNGVKSVAVDYRLRDLDPRALDFVIEFARSNNLQTMELEHEEA